MLRCALLAAVLDDGNTMISSSPVARTNTGYHCNQGVAMVALSVYDYKKATN